MNYAWPTAEIAVMGGAGAVEVLYAREAKEQENPAAFLAEKEAEYTKLFANETRGILKASQKRTKRAPLRDALLSSTPARYLGWLATIPTDWPLKRAKPMMIFLA